MTALREALELCGQVVNDDGIFLTGVEACTKKWEQMVFKARQAFDQALQGEGT